MKIIKTAVIFLVKMLLIIPPIFSQEDHHHNQPPPPPLIMEQGEKEEFTFVKLGDLKVGVRVVKDGETLVMDDMCEGYDPETNMPINLTVPRGSSVGFNTDSIKAADIALVINNRNPKYINKPSKNSGGFSMSSSEGSTNSYVFIDEVKFDTLKIEWRVAYSKLQLVDLYPSEYFAEFAAYQLYNIFEEYPDSSRYNWDQVEYIEQLDDKGIPVNPIFPYEQNGLYFVIDRITEDVVVQLKGFHDEPVKFSEEDFFEMFLYEDLSPGAYEFIAKPYDDAPESIWLKYSFIIEKPWWQTGRAQMTMGGATLLVLISIIVFIILRIQKRKEKELRWQKQLTDAELKAIRAQLNPHFLFNSLNSIQNLVNQKKNEQANSYITKLSRLLREVLNSSERQFQELKDELNLTRLYLEIEQLRFPFEFEINVDNSVNEHALVPVMLLQPYVENAIKHGVAGNPDGKVTIGITSDEKMCCFEILDNGPGLSPTNGDSMGMELGKNRIDHLNSLYSEEASIEVSNRKDTSGVIVKICLPIE